MVTDELFYERQATVRELLPTRWGNARDRILVRELFAGLGRGNAARAAAQALIGAATSKPA